MSSSRNGFDTFVTLWQAYAEIYLLDGHYAPQLTKARKYFRLLINTQHTDIF